jgi:pimeloyl-ACP methyl ester carboxylesterase
VYWGHSHAHPNIAAVNLNLLADDAALAMDRLIHDPRLHGVPSGFVGFSLAGWIIPIAATKSPAVKFMGIWSGPVCTVSEQLHFQNWAEKTPGFWKTHTQQQVDAYMKSVRRRPDDLDPRASLSKLSLPGLWLFGAQDNIVPVHLSVVRLKMLIQQGHRNFEYRIFPGYNHNVFDTPKAPAYRQMVAWINTTVAKIGQSR